MGLRRLRCLSLAALAAFAASEFSSSSSSQMTEVFLAGRGREGLSRRRIPESGVLSSSLSSVSSPAAPVSPPRLRSPVADVAGARLRRGPPPGWGRSASGVLTGPPPGLGLCPSRDSVPPGAGLLGRLGLAGASRVSVCSDSSCSVLASLSTGLFPRFCGVRLADSDAPLTGGEVSFADGPGGGDRRALRAFGSLFRRRLKCRRCLTGDRTYCF